MKHAYVIRLNYVGISIYMPYIFTSEKEAYLYGEFKFRKEYDLKSYEVERFEKLDIRFYALKG